MTHNEAREIMSRLSAISLDADCVTEHPVAGGGFSVYPRAAGGGTLAYLATWEDAIAWIAAQAPAPAPASTIEATDRLQITIGHDRLYTTRDVTEAEFRALLGATLIALGTSGELPFEASRAMETAGMFLAEEDPIGDPDMDFSALGTFLTAPQIVGTIDDAIAGTDIPGYQEHLLATENDPR